MERFGVPGVAVGLFHADTEEVAGFGVTSLEHPLPVDGDTLFQIGSITKTYTATAAMRLVEAGGLDLDKPVRIYLPDLRMADDAVTRRVTMRHLLSHTGGWAGDYFDPIGRGDDAMTLMVARLDRLEQLTPLGEVWSYNNAGFYIAGRVIEVITGKSFESALQELVLKPLGLERSFFFADDVITHRFVVGHDRSGAVARPWSIGRPSAPLGGLITSVRDLLRYARLQCDPDGVLSRESLAEMRRPHADICGLPGDAVGLGWYLFERDRHSFIRHGGATNAQLAHLVIAPEDRFALAIVTNHDNGAALYTAVQNEVLRSVLGVEAPEDAYLDRSPDELLGYAGAYEAQLQTVTLAVVNGGLVLEATRKGGFPEPDTPPRPGPPPTRLAFTGKDAVVALDPPLRGNRGDFLRSSDGAINWFRYGGRLYRQREKIT